MIRRPPRSTLFPSRRSSDLKQLFELERLGEIVVRASVEPAHHIFRCVARCEHQDRCLAPLAPQLGGDLQDRKSTRLNSSHGYISYAVFCLKKKKNKSLTPTT